MYYCANLYTNFGPILRPFTGSTGIIGTVVSDVDKLAISDGIELS